MAEMARLRLPANEQVQGRERGVAGDDEEMSGGGGGIAVTDFLFFGSFGSNGLPPLYLASRSTT